MRDEGGSCRDPRSENIFRLRIDEGQQWCNRERGTHQRGPHPMVNVAPIQQRVVRLWYVAPQIRFPFSPFVGLTFGRRIHTLYI